jgi:hypothetical protein
MNDEEFKQKLAEVAEWKIPETPRETSLNSKKKRGRKSQEEEYMEVREEMFFEEFGGVNPTYPPMLTQIKYQPVSCEDCGKVCSQGRKVEAKLHHSNGKTHWRKRCMVCSCYQNPFTGEFNLRGQMASVKWNDFMRDTKGVYKSKGNLVKQQQSVKNTDNENEIIRIYPENQSSK